MWANTRIIRTVNIPSCFHIDYFCQYPDTHSDRWYKTHQSRSCCHQIQFERMAQDVQVLSDKKKKIVFCTFERYTNRNIQGKYKAETNRTNTELTQWLSKYVGLLSSLHVDYYSATTTWILSIKIRTTIILMFASARRTHILISCWSNKRMRKKKKL